MSLVQVRYNNIEYALKILKKNQQKEGIFKEIKDRQQYEKPSERQFRKKLESIKRKHKTYKKNYGNNFNL